MKKIISLMLVVALLFSVFSFNQVGVVAKTKKPTKVEKLFKGNKLPKSAKEMNKYLKTVKVKYYTYYSTKKGKLKSKVISQKIKVHKKLASKVKNVFSKLYSFKVPIFQNGVSGFCWRNKTNSSSRSQHSYGVAIDVLVQYKIYLKLRKTNKKYKAGTGCPNPLIYYFNKKGFVPHQYSKNNNDEITCVCFEYK